MAGAPVASRTTGALCAVAGGRVQQLDQAATPECHARQATPGYSGQTMSLAAKARTIAGSWRYD